MWTYGTSMKNIAILGQMWKLRGGGGAFTKNDYWYVQSNHVVFDDLQ